MHAEVLSDERVMEVIFLYRLGIPSTDDIIRTDSWRFAAYRAIENFEQIRSVEEMKAQASKGRK